MNLTSKNILHKISRKRSRKRSNRTKDNTRQSKDRKNSRLSFHTKKNSRKRKIPRSGTKYNDKKSRQKIYNLLKNLLHKSSPKKKHTIPRKKVHSKDLKKPGGWRAFEREKREREALDLITNGVQNLLNKTNVSSSRKNTRSPQFIKAVLKDAGLLNKTGKRIYVKK